MNGADATGRAAIATVPAAAAVRAASAVRAVRVGLAAAQEDQEAPDGVAPADLGVPTAPVLRPTAAPGRAHGTSGPPAPAGRGATARAATAPRGTVRPETVRPVTVRPVTVRPPP